VSGPARHDDILDAFRQYCADRQPPALSQDAMGYLKHCLRKAARNAALADEEPALVHHQLFVLMAQDVGHPELIPEFLKAIPELVDDAENADLSSEEGADP
jgi:hypothetical protein